MFSKKLFCVVAMLIGMVASFGAYAFIRLPLPLSLPRFMPIGQLGTLHSGPMSSLV